MCKVDFLNKLKNKFIRLMLVLVAALYWGVGTINSKSAVIISLLYFGVLFVIIINIEKMMSEIKNGNGAIWYATYSTGILAIRWNPLRGTTITSFDRIIGQCTTMAIDVSKRIHNFYFWFIGTAVVFFLFYIGANYFKREDNCKKNNTMMNLLD